MEKLQGIGTSSGVADGPLYLYQSQRMHPQNLVAQNFSAQHARVDSAVAQAKADLETMYTDALAKGVDEDIAGIFQIQVMMLEDADFIAAIHAHIDEKHYRAEYAVHITAELFAADLRALEDNFMAERADDVLDAARRVVNILTGEQNAELSHVTARVILAAENLMPSEVVQLDRTKICAFVTRHGGPGSHASILARSLGIPTVTALGEDFDALHNGVRTMVDGETGEIVQNPDMPTISLFAQKMFQHVKDERSLQSLKGQPACTQNGVRIMLTANIALAQEAKKALAADAEGIGLFRSEILYLDAGGTPTEDTLYAAYQQALLAMNGRRVVVRILDAGEDKSIFFKGFVQEENPALGRSGLQLLLEHPTLLMTQLRALVRASAYGNLGILLPMVTDVQEIETVRTMLEEAKKQMSAEGRIVSDRIAIGAAIETPAAAMMADLIARHVDFLSVGTNDLAQYMLARDRKSAHTADQKHPAVLRILAQIAGMTKAANIPLCVCGECAADASLAGFFAAIGVSELSMAPSAVLKMKKALRSLTGAECRTALVEALQVQVKENMDEE